MEGVWLRSRSEGGEGGERGERNGAAETWLLASSWLGTVESMVSAEQHRYVDESW